MHDTSDASSFRHQGTHLSADQRSPSATVPALGSASADAATAAMIAPARTAIRLTVNGVRHRIDVEDRWTLVELLRDHLELTGTKLGCDRSECGTCTVLMGSTCRRWRAWRSTDSYRPCSKPSLSTMRPNAGSLILDSRVVEFEDDIY